jgi:gliding motility-associated-like protein
MTRDGIFLVLLLYWFIPVCSQAQKYENIDHPAGTFATDSSVMVSSYLNALDPRDEWTELLVVADNIDLRNWTLQDNNSAQTAFQPLITFNNIALWNNMRAGTIIMIWHRQVGTAGNSHTTDNNKADGYVEVSANDVAYFNGGSFGTAPLYNGATLNIAGAGDLLQLLTPAGAFAHALGHKTTFGSSWTTLPSPKLNHKASLADGEAVFVCPGSKVDEFGHLSPQDGTTWTAKSNTEISFGLPNCESTTAANSYFWHNERDPDWINPVLTGNVNPANTQVTLNWNAAVDPFPADGTQGYLILRNTANLFAGPLDGHTYAVGDITGGATVIANISSSQTLTFTDNMPVPCSGPLYYQIYAYRYTTDALGNDYNGARGRAYNETNWGQTQVFYPAAVAPVSASSDRTGFCADDPGNITLSATGGSGTTLNWFSASCGGTPIGAGSGLNNSITISSPTVTTTYYARWENLCGVSSCADVTVSVLPATPVSITISASANPVCTGTSVTFTATPVNPGTSPGYQWKINGTNAGSNNPVYTYVPLNGDDVTCVLTSNASCGSGSPATSNNIIMSVSNAIPVSLSIVPDVNPVCQGTTVTFTGTPVNPGPAPVYQWKVNGIASGSNSPVFAYVPVNGDIVSCVLVSDASCASGNPATSNSVIMIVSADIPVSISISVSENPVCTGTPVTFTALPNNPGTAPVYQWKVNGANAGAGNTVFSLIPADADIVTCALTSNASCASGNVAISNSIVMSVNAAIPLSVIIDANPANTICQGTAVTYTATSASWGTSPSFQWFVNGNPAGGNTPSWSNVPANGDAVFCVVTSNASCATNNPANSNTITISATPTKSVQVSVTPNHSMICPGTMVTFTALAVNEGAAPSFEWLVDGVSVQQGISPVYSTNTILAGIPVVCRLTSSLPCVTQQSVFSLPLTLSPAPLPSVVLSDQDYLCTGTNTPLDAGADFNSYIWQDGSAGRYMNITTAGLYKVTVTDSLGCTASDSVIIKNCSRNIYVPSAFSPNGDGTNDVFRVFASPDDVTEFTMQVFNRWGEKIFESNSVLIGWNGMKTGNYCPGDSYIWIVRYKETAGGPASELVTKKGTVELVR